jgi:membrane associated rhomboid family serine protease
LIVVFLLQIWINGFTEAFVLNELSWSEWWRFLTAIFLHGGFGHLVLNIFALAFFGSVLERFIGSRRFLVVFFITGILANLVSINFYDSSLGASGAIFGVIGTLIFVRPMMVIWAFGMPMPIFVAGVLWALQDVIGVFNPSGVGNIAHLSGMFFGFLFGLMYRNRMKKAKGVNVSIDENEIRRWEDKYLRA